MIESPDASAVATRVEQVTARTPSMPAPRVTSPSTVHVLARVSEHWTSPADPRGFIAKLTTIVSPTGTSEVSVIDRSCRCSPGSSRVPVRRRSPRTPGGGRAQEWRRRATPRTRSGMNAWRSDLTRGPQVFAMFLWIMDGLLARQAPQRCGGRGRPSSVPSAMHSHIWSRACDGRVSRPPERTAIFLSAQRSRRGRNPLRQRLDEARRGAGTTATHDPPMADRHDVR